MIITDIYSPAGEKQIEGISSGKLVELIVQNSNAGARYLPTKEDVLNDLKGRVKKATSFSRWERATSGRSARLWRSSLRARNKECLPAFFAASMQQGIAWAFVFERRQAADR